MKIRLPIRKPGPPLKRPPQLKLKASVARSRRAPVIEEEDFNEEPEPNMRLSHAFVVVLVLHVIAVAGVFAFNSIKARQADIFSATKDEAAKTAPADPGTTTPADANASNPAPASNDSSDPSNGPAPAQQPTAPVQAAAAATPAATASGKTYEMQPGDTLTKIAKTNGVTVADLEKANNISDPTKLREGQSLTIPPATTTPVAAPAVKPAATSAAAGSTKDSGKIYTVVKGDNPVKIAKRLKISQAALLSVNPGLDPRKLQIGQKLKIPASAK